MNENDRSSVEPMLSPDFAARVLLRADRTMARRRRIRRSIAGVAGACVLAIAASLGMRGTQPAVPAPPSPVASNISGGELLTASRIDQGDALGYMFPDAAPLARFDSTYSAAISGAGDDDALALNSEDDSGSP